MKAEIIYLTPEYAKELLKQNIGNRKLKVTKSHYANQMKNGLWKENGEPIIMDTSGFIKDGQHRLYACIEANYSFNVPFITDVDPNVMDTIDTGVNRSLGDVLEFNDYKFPRKIAMLTKAVMKHENGKLQVQGGWSSQSITNSQGLSFADKNKEYLMSLHKAIGRVEENTKASVLNYAEMGWFFTAISEKNIATKHVDFMKGIYSGKLGSESCTYYAYQRLLRSKINKAPLPAIYKYNLMVKCWNIFNVDDVPVTKLVIKSDKLAVIK